MNNPIEGINIGQTTKATLEQDNYEHDPNTWNILIDHLCQANKEISGLKNEMKWAKFHRISGISRRMDEIYKYQAKSEAINERRIMDFMN